MLSLTICVWVQKTSEILPMEIFSIQMNIHTVMTLPLCMCWYLLALNARAFNLDICENAIVFRVSVNRVKEIECTAMESIIEHEIYFQFSFINNEIRLMNHNLLNRHL